jgi:hypothetical protein
MLKTRIAVLTTTALVVAGISAGMAGAYGPTAGDSSYGRTPTRTPPPTTRTGYGTPAPTTRTGYGTPANGGLTVSFPKASLGTALSKGVEANAYCAAACQVVGQLKIGAKTAKALHIGRVVGTRKGRLTKAGALTLHIKFSKNAARGLKKLKTVKLTVVLKAGTAKVVRNISLAR